ncbi:MAG: hypothetical protein ACFFCD_04390 [Promethearchaeota archaeon]
METPIKIKMTIFHYSPLSSNDRWRAFFSGYSSEVEECPFYKTQGFISICELTQNIHYIEDCQGKCFKNGYCCHKIHQAVEQNNLPFYTRFQI